ncbi:MAG TPA: ATP-binding protein [Acidimicrobiales bacterium]|nr:ATP-binding protein [Acidimicrobiales bacterium]
MARDVSLDRLQSVLRGLAFGAEPTRLLNDALAGAVAATQAREGAILRAGAGSTTTVASTGSVSRHVIDAAHAAMGENRMIRRRDAETGMVAVAEPLRAGSRVLGAVCVGGGLTTVDPTPLSLYADAAAVVLLRRPAAAVDAVPEVLDTLSLVASDLDMDATLGHTFDAATRIFGATSGFVALHEGSTARIASYRGIEQERLVAASRHPEFKALLGPGELRVDGPAHPAVGLLSRLGEVAVSLPLATGAQTLGRLVVFLAEPPDAARRSLLSGFARNVSLAVRAAKLYRRIEDHEEQLAAMVHAMANPVVVVDEEARVLEVNGAASEVFRLSAGFEIGFPVRGRLGSAALEEMLTGGADRSDEVVLPTAEGEPRVYRATVRRMRSGGRNVGRVLVLDDLTAERSAEAVKADFVAVMGHELRTPLTVMKGYVHTLVRRGDSLTDERRSQALGAVQSNLVRLERLIEDLLFISAIEQRRAKLDLQPLELGAHLMERADDRVSVRRPRRSVDVVVDQGKLDQVVHHLVDNACKYSEGHVVVELVDHGDAVEVSVTDSGPGIYSGDIPTLFERFRQLDGTSTRRHGGVGIGLYLSRRIVEAMGGRIWCESRLGVGSRFTFLLPKDGPDPDQVPAPGAVRSAQ